MCGTIQTDTRLVRLKSLLSGRRRTAVAAEPPNRRSLVDNDVWAADCGDFCQMTYHPACLFVRPLCCDNRSIV
jgi:hypothetical protein